MDFSLRRLGRRRRCGLWEHMTTHLPSYEGVLDAARQIEGVAVRTPLIESPALNAVVGGRVLMKAETLQRTGAFKFRGAYNRISRLTPDEKGRGVVAFSSGNHAQGVAAAAALVGAPALIVMPSDSPQVKVDGVIAFGGEVRMYDRWTESREAIGAAIAIVSAKLLPLRSTLMWRFMLADNLTECGKMIAEISNGKRMTRERLEQNMVKMRQINARMVKSRSHLAATSGESHISPAMMEAMQHAHRKIVNTTELLLTTAAKLQAPTLNEHEIRLLDRHFNRLQRDLRLTVRLIKGHYARRIRIDTSINPELGKLAARLHYEWQGFLWLSTNMRNEIAALVILLQRSRNKWLDKKELQRLKEYLRNDTDPEQQ